MDRRSLLLAAVALTRCSETPPAPPSPPSELPGGWTRAAVRTVPTDQAPELARRLGARLVTAADYSGPAPVTVTYYTMGADASAFELVQKWRAKDHEFLFSRGRNFVTIQAAGADPRAAKEIAAFLENGMVR